MIYNFRKLYDLLGFYEKMQIDIVAFLQKARNKILCLTYFEALFLKLLRPQRIAYFWHGFAPPLNPVVKNTMCTPCDDTDSNEPWDLAHKTM